MLVGLTSGRWVSSVRPEQGVPASRPATSGWRTEIRPAGDVILQDDEMGHPVAVVGKRADHPFIAVGPNPHLGVVGPAQDRRPGLDHPAIERQGTLDIL